MKALIDADILLYEVGSYTDDEGHPLSWPLCKSRLDAKIEKIMESAGCTEYHLFITGDNNFRDAEATIKPYKGHRTSPKPPNYANVKKYLTQSDNFVGHRTVVDGMEADDAMAIEQSKSSVIAPQYMPTVICSRDKDLKMVPGWHYSWQSGNQKEKEKFWVNELDGLTWFFTQLLTGDSTDNIPGLYRVGPAAAKKLLDGLTDALSMYTTVQHEYELRFGSYWKMFMHENARLLWMLRSEDDDVREMLDDLERQRQGELQRAESF